MLSPYYRHMGGLYGSEYWTYLLPRRIGTAMTANLTNPPCDPVGTRRAVKLRLLDAASDTDLNAFRNETRRLAEHVGGDGLHQARLEYKRRRRAHDEQVKPLDAYRTEELAHCRECFFGPDPSYHRARRRFVHKLAAETATEEPTCLAN